VPHYFVEARASRSRLLSQGYRDQAFAGLEALEGATWFIGFYEAMALGTSVLRSLRRRLLKVAKTGERADGLVHSSGRGENAPDRTWPFYPTIEDGRVENGVLGECRREVVEAFSRDDWCQSWPGDWLSFSTDKPPMAVWLAGVTGPTGPNTVDMMDNARALPTCPQPSQQKRVTLSAA
jgi:hypothetical protein